MSFIVDSVEGDDYRGADRQIKKEQTIVYSSVFSSAIL
ncbi:hypothetical protein KP77_16850 [Jeotgalibacillus alimentarius]|uniref:Uncharacterized protein n=1 Tax=Jeotgalibacillus alimentarius TaxID=135826 RepID=A0A0C2RJF6_9BACL|nr:hypothetical protein KP77_16850 [Jeotgalibacillus alimentarius]